MPSAEEFKILGDDAYKAGKLDDAINAYSEAIKLDESNCIYYSNRSAAYLKKGEAESALGDAESCLQVDPSFIKGYSRKAAALQAMKRYKEAADALKAGLTKDPDNEMLAKELKDVLQEQKLVASTRAHRASVIQSQSSKKKATQADSISDFVKLTRFSLEFEIAAMQAQLMLLNSLAEKSDDEKLQMLFSILDKDGDGFISATELADGVRKNNQDLSFSESLDRAIDLVAVYDKNKDAKLNLFEFKIFIEDMMENLGTTYHDFAEFLIMSMLFSDGNDAAEQLAGEIVAPVVEEEILARGEFYNALVDKRMLALFMLFDLNQDGVVEFAEVALGLHKLTNDMESSAVAAVGCLLTFDEDESRSLDYVQFAKLIMNMAAASDKKFEEVADELTIAMCDAQVVTAKEMEELIVADELYNAALDEAEAQREALEAIGALQYTKLHKLFDLWDTDHDNYIALDELVIGMRKFQEAMEIEESVQQAALTMLAFDENSDQKLDRVEFALAITNYAKALEADPLDLIDFMVVVSALGDDDATEKAYLKAIAPSITEQIAAVQDKLNDVALLEG
jgi:Ca2+-binding EF-hand superfamily protein/Arc/MetJ-type ribon-helix-helix transcriptional regulator